MDIYHHMHDLKNINEKRVWEMLSLYLEEADTSGMCLCPICLTDIAAVTLNAIPAHYQTEPNLTRAKEKLSDVELFRQLKKAILLVSSRPHH